MTFYVAPLGILPLREVKAMPPYRLARLVPDQMTAIENLENELGVTLVAYEPMCDTLQDATEERLDDSAEAQAETLDGIVDTYRTHDPEVI